MYGSSSSLGTSHGGPASTWSTSTPGASVDAARQRGVVAPRVHDDVVAAARRAPWRARRRGRSGRRRRRRRAPRAGWRARRPSRSSSRSTGPSPPRGPRPSRRGSARARSARAPRPGPRGRARPPPRGRRSSGAPRRPARRAASRPRRPRRAPPRGPRSCRARRPACRGASPPAARGRATSSGSGAGRRAGGPSPCAARPAAGPRCRRGWRRPSRTGRSAPPRAKRPSRSVPVTRARRRASLMTTAARGELAGVALARVDDAVLDHARRRRAGVPEERVEVGDVDEQEVVAVGRRVAHVGDPALRRVVLDVDRRDVAARTAAEPLLAQVLELVRALEDDDVEVLVAQPLGRELGDAVARPVVGARDARRRRGRGRAAPGRRSRGRRGRTRSSTRRARARAGSSCRHRHGREPVDRREHVADRRRRRGTGWPGDRADARAAARARDVDVQQLVRHAPRPPADGAGPSARTARRPACRRPRRGAPGRCCRRRRRARAGEHAGELGRAWCGRRGRGRSAAARPATRAVSAARPGRR